MFIEGKINLNQWEGNKNRDIYSQKVHYCMYLHTKEGEREIEIQREKSKREIYIKTERKK